MIIVDTDGGVDDALALLFALASPHTRIEAITTVHGNVPVETATANIIEILHIAGSSIPVSSGCAAPLAASAVFATDVHGSDGLGGWTRTAPQALPPAGLSASQTIASLARKFPGAITLVTIGPLTNAATALREDPEGFRQLKEIVIMGGAVEERGNVTTNAEFNFFADPQAARETFHSGIPVTLVGLDVTHRVEFSRERLDLMLGDRSGLPARFLRCLCDQMFSFYRPLLGRDVFFLHDPLAIGVALDRSLVETRAMRLDIETAGELTRGMVVAERRPWLQDPAHYPANHPANHPANVDVCLKVDAARFIDLFSERVSSYLPIAL